MKGKKILFLTLALLLPVAIFIFLKMFGRNEFAVPPMHQEGEVEHPEDCNFFYSSPYAIPDSLTESLGLNSGDSLYVLYFEPAPKSAVNRILTEFSENVKVIEPSDLSSKLPDTATLKKCVLLMKPEHSMVLIDQKKRIRGYFDGSDRDEIDRLIVEISVILKRY